MTKEEKINKEQEELKQRRQYNIDHNLPSEELENIRKNLWLHNTLYKIMSLFNTISGFEKDFERYKFDFNGRPIIFAFNHVRMQDIAIEMEAIKNHMVLLSGDFKNVHPDISGKLLESMSEEKSNFLFSMTQDTKKPIDNILEVSKILLDDKNKEDMKTGIKVIENNARGLKNIINNVLDISNISSSKLVVSNETYNAISLLNECIKKIEKDVNKNVTIETEISKNIPGELYGDSVKLKQVIMSILINASKYTKEGYIKVSANEIVKYDVCRLIIEIEDTGCGMSVDKLNELLKTNTDLEDTDLLKLNSLDVDLKLAFKIIRKLGGFINIRSEKEKGSTFTIILDQKIKVSKDYYSEYIFNKKKVMVVSDKLQTLKDINTLASKYDIELLTTMHSSDIIERVKDGESFDLILLEDDMKPISGFGTLGKLQEAKEGFNVPTVIMLNKNKESIKDHYVEDGFSNYIRKQNLEEDFDKVIKKYI